MTRQEHDRHPLQFSLGLSQRWKEERSIFVPPANRYDASQHGVTEVKQAQCVSLLQMNHYLKTCPVVTRAYGLWRKDSLKPARLVGCAVFGMPASQQTITSRTGYAAEEGLELTRFLLTSDVEFNGESAFLGEALRDLMRTKPNLRVIIAHSDPTPRIDASGIQVFKGHVGTIYKASNALYTGRTNPRNVYMTKDGDVVPDRLFSKIRRDKRGGDGAERRLIEMGASSRACGQDRRTWLDEVLASSVFQKRRHPGMHSFVLPLSKGTRRALQERSETNRPYPKAVDRAIAT